MSDQIANSLVDEMIGEVAATLRDRRVSWAEEVDAEQAQRATESARRANDTAPRAPALRGVPWASRGGWLVFPPSLAPIAQDIRYPQGAQSLDLMAQLAEQAPMAQPATPAPAPQQATPTLAPQPQVVYVEKVVVMSEPYYNWREQLLSMFRSLSPEKVENSNRFKLGYVARVINPPRPHDAYFLACKYDINTSPGVKIDSWRAAVESLIRNGQAVVTRDRTGTAIQFDSGRWKARCGISIRIVMRSLVETIGF